MSIYQSLTSNDINITPFRAHKQYEIIDTNADSYDVKVLNGNFEFNKYNVADINDPDVQALPTSSGYYDYLIWNSVYYNYYENYYSAHYNTLDIPHSEEHRIINSSIIVFAIPQSLYGEQLTENTISITNTGSNIEIIDDGFGNLIDANVNTSSFDLIENYGVGNWLMNDLYLTPLYSKDYSSYNENMMHSNVSYIISPYNNRITIPKYNNSYSRIYHDSQYELQDDYTISFQLSPDTNSPIIYNDWFLPSQNEAALISSELYSYNVGNLSASPYWTSTEFDASNAIYYLMGTNSFSDLKTQSYTFRLIRTFNSSNIYQLRDVGETGGWIFHIINNMDGTFTYYETANSDNTANIWSNISSSLGTTSPNVGTGYQNTIDIASQVGCTTSSAITALDYISYGSVQLPVMSKNGIKRNAITLQDESINQPYPFKFEYYITNNNFSIIYSCNDGYNTHTLTSNLISTGSLIYVALSKTNNDYVLSVYSANNTGSYQQSIVSESFSTNIISNQCDIILGKYDNTYYSGSIYDFKLLNIGDTFNPTIYWTNNVKYQQLDKYIGNVFYKTGTISITSPNETYLNLI